MIGYGGSVISETTKKERRELPWKSKACCDEDWPEALAEDQTVSKR